MQTAPRSTKHIHTACMLLTEEKQPHAGPNDVIRVMPALLFIDHNWLIFMFWVP